MSFSFKSLFGFVQKMAPEAVPIVSGIYPLAGAILYGIVQAEKLIGPKKGDEKKKHVLTFLTTASPALIPLIENVIGKDLVDDDKFVDGLGKVVDGMVELANSFNALEKVQTS